LQALLNLINKSGVPRDFIEAKQARAAERGHKNYFEVDSEEEDERDAEAELPKAELKRRMKANNAFKMLSGIIDPTRRLLSAATQVYFKKLFDGTIEVVRFSMCSNGQSNILSSPRKFCPQKPINMPHEGKQHIQDVAGHRRPHASAALCGDAGLRQEPPWWRHRGGALSVSSSLQHTVGPINFQTYASDFRG
jgi:hypothetical protein